MAMPSRGSDKVLEQLFGAASVSSEQLATALAQARQAGLRFDRLWWKGQPRLDLIKGVATIKMDQLATAVTDLVRLHTDDNQVSFEAFPKGTPQIDAVDLHVTVNRNFRG